jgi:hypothetical protein
MSNPHPDIVTRYIKTKNKTRKIIAYRSDECDLRIKHQKICNFINERFVPSIFTKGYVKNRSIYHNAISHMYNDYFIMLDIKDFFQQITHKKLAEKLYYEINLIKKQQVSKKECYDIVKICSVSNRGIPLGFITSPVLSNIYLKDFDCILYGQLKHTQLKNVIYTRYADDITISFKHEGVEKTTQIESMITDIVSSLLLRFGLRINKKKTRSYNLNISNHVRVTGVNIIKKDSGERKLTIGKKTKNKLFWDAINCYITGDKVQVQKIKGMQSFVLSIEKQGYESSFSHGMIEKLHSLGFNSLKHLIDSLA